MNADVYKFFYDHNHLVNLLDYINLEVDEKDVSSIAPCRAMVALKRRDDGGRYVLLTNIKSKDFFDIFTEESKDEIDFYYEADGYDYLSYGEFKEHAHNGTIDDRDEFVINLANYNKYTEHYKFIYSEMLRVNLITAGTDHVTLIADTIGDNEFNESE